MIPSSFYNNLIKPIRDQQLRSLIQQVSHDLLSPWDKELRFAERLEPIAAFRQALMSWAQDLKGLERFPYFYVVNGNTEWLNHLIGFGKGVIGWKSGDYTYYGHMARCTGREFSELQQPGPVDEMIISWPGYANGDSTELEFSRSCPAKRKHLDVAYLGLVRPEELDVSEFSTVAISMSKTLGIPFNRVAMVFSQEEITTLSVMNRIGYVNLSGVNLATHLLKNLPAGYFWARYHQAYADLCAKHSLRPTNCLLFAYDQNGSRISTAPHLREIMDAG